MGFRVSVRDDHDIGMWKWTLRIMGVSSNARYHVESDSGKRNDF